jgi:hypothetical protein
MLAELLEEDFDIALVDTQLDGQVDRGRRHGRHGRAEGACRQGSGRADRRTASCHAGIIFSLPSATASRWPSRKSTDPRWTPRPVGAGSSAHLCDVLILVDQFAEPVVSLDVVDPGWGVAGEGW